MWILPKNLTSPTFPSALAMGELTSDSTAFLETDYDSPLFARSKPLPWKMLCRKWKQDSFLRLRFGMIYGHSLGKNFKMSAWYREVFPVNHSPLLENETEIKTQDTYSRTLSMASNDADQDLFSWRMSKESFQASSPERVGQTQQAHQFCSMSLESWSGWVTKQRQEYSQRLKSALPTKESGSLSWPTITVNESKNSTGGSQFNRSQPPLGTAVLMHGPVAQANSNTHGNRQESWATPQASDYIEGRRTELEYNQKCLGRDMKQWATPQTDDGDNVTRKSGVYRSLTRDVQTPPSAAKLNSQWVTQLMNLPLGWTSPSCPASVILNWPKFVSGWLKLTTAQTNSDSSETESFQQQQPELF